jgi:ATP-binding cassette subfamily F protein uup
MSGGEQRRVALARLLVSAPDLAVLDEPTNHLDAGTIEWLEKYLVDEYPGALVLITHDRYLLDHVATRTLEVEAGEVYDYDGGYERYLEQKAERQAHAARTEQNRQNFLRTELEWLRRQPKARTTKQAARVERAEAALAAKGPKAEKAASFDLDRLASGKTILELRGLGAKVGERLLFSGLDLFLREGERVGVVGANGTGKTTLLRVLLGQLPAAEGTVAVGQNTRIVYLDQQRSGLDDEKSVLDNVMGEQSTLSLGGQTVEPRSYLERFAFDRNKQRQPVGSLSGGERARVALARMLRQSANLVVMDEPTNDLDVATLGALESMLVDYSVTALVVTHDRYFLDRVATAILSFEGDGRVLLYPGNYETFRRLRAEAQAGVEAEARAAPSRTPETRPKPTKKGLTGTQKRELDALPESIEKVELRIAEINALLGDPSTYAGGGKEIPKLQAELVTQRAEVDRLMARWEELEGMV